MAVFREANQLAGLFNGIGGPDMPRPTRFNGIGGPDMPGVSRRSSSTGGPVNPRAMRG